MVKKLYYLPTCHSTNDTASAMLSTGQAREGYTIYTFEQTAGRGQRGNRWESAPGQNLTFSSIAAPTYLHASRQFSLNMAISLGMADYLQPLLGEGFRIKWPNDLYFRGRKLGGILIENFLRGDGHIAHSIIGVGINVNQTSFSLPLATSLSLATGKQYQLETLLDGITDSLYARLGQLQACGPEGMRQEYLQLLMWYQEEQPFAEMTEQGEELPFRGQILGVHEDGRLAVAVSDKIRYFGFKEVKYLL